MPSAWDHLRYWLQARRRARQRRDLRARLLRAWVRLDELRRYVERDRRAERAERDRLVARIKLASELVLQARDAVNNADAATALQVLERAVKVLRSD